MKQLVAFLTAGLFAVPATAQTKLLASNGMPGDNYGQGVAIEGGLAVVGAPEADPVFGGEGIIYVYERAATGWIETAQLIPGDPQLVQLLGFDVDVSGDLIVGGADFDGLVQGNPIVGAAYVFRRTGGAWGQVAKLKPSDLSSIQFFAHRVAVDGVTVLGSSTGDPTLGQSAGAVYVFREVAGAFTQIDKLFASDGAAFDEFGYSLDMSGDTIVVGSRGDDDLGPGSGAVYVFREVGGVFTQVAKLTASDGAGGDEFGSSVAIDGSRVVVGSTGADNGVPGSNRGAAYVFDEVGGVWTETGKLTASTAVNFDFLGKVVALDGDLVVVGSEEADTQSANPTFNRGAAYVFANVAGPGVAPKWVELKRLTAPDGGQDDLFACSVGVSDGAVLCGMFRDDDLGTDAGAAYVFEGCRPLSASGRTVSELGGSVDFTLSAGSSNGGRSYALLGSISGALPGTALPGASVVLPLNVDGFTTGVVMPAWNTPTFAGFLGALDAAGDAQAQLNVPPLPPGLVGLQMEYAYVLVGPTDFASNAVPVVIVP